MSQVRVKVLVPQQEFYFWYDEDDWKHAVETDGLVYLMDLDLSNLDPQMDVYGPDGEVVAGW